MAVKGVFTSDAGIPGDRVGDFASSLLQWGPAGMAPLFALSAGMPSSDASDVIITWFEEGKLSGRVNVINNAGVGTSLQVDDPTQYQPGGNLLVESTGEYVLITAIAGDILTVVRGFAQTPISAIDGTTTPVPVQKIGTAHEEGSSRPGAVANLGYPVFNYLQIFRNEWDATRTARQVQYHTGDVVAKNRQDAAMLHAEDIEKSSWFGVKSIGVKNNKPFRTMDGLATMFVSNVNTIASPKYVDVRNFFELIFSKNIKGKPNERICFSGNNALAMMDTLSMHFGVLNLEPGDTEFGLKVTKWRTPWGDISVVTHPLFVESPFWNQDMYVMHPGAIRYRYLHRTTEDSYDKDGSRAGVDADFGVYTAELSIEYKAEKTAGKWTGLDGTADLTALV